MRNLLALLAVGVALAGMLPAQGRKLLQKPTLSQSHIAFTYAGDLWTVERAGGAATRLTNGVGVESEAAFSPDGKTIAFTGEYDGNVDVFTVPATGGTPKRITYHPDADSVVGWTPDGTRILFRSTRDSFSLYSQLYQVGLDGGLPKAMPLPMAHAGSYSADGKKFVYAPVGENRGFANYVAWKRYRGGRASYLWIADMATLDTVKIPRTDSQDFDAMWVGDKVYFLSDRTGKVSLYRFDPATKAVTDLLKNSGYDIYSAQAGPGAIVYDQFGDIHLYDPKSGKDTKVEITVEADMQEVRPRFVDVAAEVLSARLSATGVRAVVEAHGEILTIPAQKGDARNLTNTPGVMERNPSWSPDGQTIAYFSDLEGSYALHLKPQSGAGETRKIALDKRATYYTAPHWSPDGKRLAFRDSWLQVWQVEVATGKAAVIHTDRINDRNTEVAWSPDSKWIAYTAALPNRIHALFLYSIETGKTRQVTDGLSDVRYPAFDRDGQFLYFAASTDYGTSISGLDMSSDAFSTTRSIYAVVLSNEGGSPVAPESDEEKQPGERSAKPQTGAVNARVDIEGIESRIVALPLPTRIYSGLATGKAGVLFLAESRASGRAGAGAGRTLHKYDLRTKKLEVFAGAVLDYSVSADGEKILLTMGGGGEGVPEAGAATAPRNYAIVSTGAPMKAGDGALKLANLMVKVDPQQEWQQIYREVWRIQRAMFYDPGFHGVNTEEAEQTFLQYVQSVASRSDLNFIFQEMLGEFSVGHLRGGGGTLPNPKRVPGGLLGADYEIADGRYRLKRIYTGESWNSQLRAPLAQPGLKVKQGDFVLAINGVELKGSDDISQLLEATVGKSVTLKVSGQASGGESRDVTVVPVATERPLRNRAWIEDNRRKVDQMSGGKLAYVYMPDTGLGGLTSFNRYFFAQTDKQGLVLDERFNVGGQVADYVIEVLKRPLMSYWKPRVGDVYRTPAGSNQGPKVMIVNEFAGSGGDAMPWMFRQAKLGPLVGKRTWGGLVGIGATPQLMDGGTVTSPSFGFFSPAGEWEVENRGVAPDVEVDMDPKAVAAGKDPQLERAVQLAMESLGKMTLPAPKVPKFPDYHRR